MIPLNELVIQRGLLRLLILRWLVLLMKTIAFHLTY